MPPMPNVPNVLKVQVLWKDEQDVVAMSVLHFRYTGGPPSAADCVTMADSIATDAGSDFQGILPTTNACVGAIVTDLTSPTSGQGASSIVTTGTRTGAALSPGTAALVNFQIGRRYRGGKPRVYLPVGVGADITAGKWSSSFTGNVEGSWNAFKNHVLTDGAGCSITQQANVSYVSGGARRTTPVVDSIVGFSVPLLIASQRRRNRNQ